MSLKMRLMLPTVSVMAHSCQR